MCFDPETHVKVTPASGLRPSAQEIWKGVGPLTESALSPEEARLVTEHGSMTRLIEELSGVKASISVLRQRATTLLTDEALLLSNTVGAYLCREICLSCDDMPMLVARSVWSDADTVVDKALSRLGDTSLAKVLFGEDHCAPVSLREVARLPVSHPLCELVAAAAPGTPVSPALVARRSRYWIGVQPLILTEIFLPALKELLRMRLTRNHTSGEMN